MQKRIVETNLVGREEVFKLLAVAELTQLPVLLEGPPGIGKTNCIRDYGEAVLGKDAKKTDFFVIETDEQTRASQVKGRPNMQKLTTEHLFEIEAPIADAQYILINEVDKASSNLRNALLGIMNEKYVFHGDQQIPCDWSLFAGACNEIPRNEINSPFWDRFVLKMKLNRMASDVILEYLRNGGKNFKQEIEINWPDIDDLRRIRIPDGKLEKFMNLMYTECTDRTLTHIPRVVAAISAIFNTSITNAMVKTATYMVSPDFALTISKKISNAVIDDLYTKIKLIEATKDEMMFLEDCKKFVSKLQKAKIDPDEAQEIEHTFKQVVSASFVGEKLKITDDQVNELLNSKDWDKNILESAKGVLEIK